jgi:hypothetical protein
MQLRLTSYLLLASALLPAADLPVREVVLYKHGVGFFERSGKLAPGETARLDFNTSEMNDVLKSLTISGGKIAGLRYDPPDPLAHKLAEFPFQIGEGGLPAVLDQLKGARVELKLGTETLAGTILGARTIAATDKQPERDQLNLLLDSGDFRSVDLSAASAIRLPDAKLQQQFRDYLAALAASRAKDKRSVYIDSSDSRERDLIASYMIPAPVWKSSYRLLLGDKAPLLEGWAIVDNTTGEDWTKVQLSLVSGRPISFVSQLYAPKYINRPGAELADDSAAQAVVHSGAFEVDGAGEAMVKGDLAGMGNEFKTRVRAAAPAPPPPPAPKAMNEASGAYYAASNYLRPAVAPTEIVAAAEGRALGDLFEYRIAQPVSIRKNESAMLPFLQQSIEGRKLLIYSEHSSQHPTNAAELTNSSGKTLDGGPVTVYDGGGYAGEALMETLKTGDKRLISYAVDLGTRITEAFHSDTAVVREIHANRGIITTKYSVAETRTYTIRNVDAKAKTLIVEHPLRPSYSLLNQKPTEKTASNYRFELALAANATKEFAVNEERVFDQTAMVSNYTPDNLVSFTENRALSAAGRKALEAIAAQKRLVTENDRALQDATSQINTLTSDEDRVRRNISSLNSVSGQQQQVQTYARQLDSIEHRLATLRDRQAELQKQKTALQTALDKLVDSLSF